MNDSTRPEVNAVSIDPDTGHGVVVERLFAPAVSFVFGAADRPNEMTIGVATWILGDSPNFNPQAEELPQLVLPPVGSTEYASSPARVVVAAEGRDARIAHSIIRLLNPENVTIELVHVTWLPGIAASPIDASGIDNPGHQDLLMYDGAREALIERASELREAGFRVTTHLRLARHPADAIVAHLQDRPVQLFVLGLGRHGAGIGRDVMRANPLPLLFVNARG